MPLQGIKTLLLNKIGLDTETIGDSSLQHAVDKRLAATQKTDLGDYFALLSKDRRELDALIEEIVVPETWFFRNSIPFQSCVDCAQQLLKKRLGQGEPLRILSVPCSTGEEPYSIAIALTESNINLDKVEISAFDISQAAIKSALAAHYRRNAFREMAPDLMQKYFREEKQRYHLADKIQDRVRFEHANVIYSALSPRPQYFDIIFCRNLLIYFNEPVRRQVYEKLHRALKNDGYLFVGHVETALVDKKRFQPLADKRSYGFIKRSIGERPSRGESETPAAAPAGSIAKEVPMATGQRVISLNFVDQLIEKGEDARAAHLLKQYLSLQPESIEAKYLEGKRLYYSGNIKEADSWLKKLLYLSPNHQASLQLLLQMAEKRYDLEAVRSYRSKLNRLRKRN